jgi:hypothetical protein
MKNITILVFALIISVTIKAQFYSIKSVFAGLHTPPNFNINVGVEYAPKVSKTVYLFTRPTYNRRAYNGKRTGAIGYIDIPLGVKLFLSGDPVRDFAQTIDFSIGPYVGYAFKGKYRPTIGAPEKNMTFGTGPNAQFDAIDYGYFANTQFGLGPVVFGISAQVGLKEQDLSKIGLSATPAKYKADKFLTITVGIRLPNKKMIKAIDKRN